MTFTKEQLNLIRVALHIAYSPEDCVPLNEKQKKEAINLACRLDQYCGVGEEKVN